MRKTKGQSTLEYAILIAIIVGALLAMQIYMNRSVQGNLRQTTDDMGGQYSAGNMTSKFTIQQEDDMITKDEYGTSGLGQGTSRYEVVTAASTKTTATLDDAEKITIGLDEEDLLPSD